MPNDVYDKKGSEQDADGGVGGPDLGPGHNKPSRNFSDPRGSLRSAEKGFYNPSDPSEESSAESAENLSESESAAGSSSQGGFAGDNFEDQGSNQRQKAAAFAKRNKGKIGVGLGIAGGGIFGIILLLMSLIPLKIEHMVQNLQDRFNSPVNSAVEKMSDNLWRGYVRDRVIPSYKNCGVIVNKNCKVNVISGQSPVTNLYNAWAKAGLEKTVFKDYEFEYDRGSGAIRVHGKDLPKDGITMDDFMSKKEMKVKRAAILENETKWKRVLLRYPLGSHLEKHYGAKRYLFFDGTRKKVEGSIESKKDSARLALYERVIKPRDASLFLAITCVMDTTCHPQDVDTSGPDVGTSETEREQRTKLSELAAQYNLPGADLDVAAKQYANISKRGYQKYVTDQILQKVFKVGSQEAAEQTTNKAIDTYIPIIGWIDLAAQLAQAAHDAGPKVKKLVYIVNAAAAVQVFMTYQTAADEIHTGEVDPAIVGSLTDSLGKGEKIDNDEPVGGTASAEQAPMYNELMDQGSAARSSSTASLLSAVLPKQAYAATAAATSASSYKCDDGSTPSEGHLCDEEVLGQGGIQGLNLLNKYYSTVGYPGYILGKTWNDTVGKAMNFITSAGGLVGTAVDAAQSTADAYCGAQSSVPIVGDVLGGVAGFFAAPAAVVVPPAALPAYCKIKDTVQPAISSLLEAVSKWLIPSAVGTNMGGGRTFTVMASGANVAGNDACEQAGCGNVDAAVAAKQIEQQKQEKLARFQQQPMFARLFSTADTGSLISKLSMATPIDIQGSAQRSFASVLLNPVGNLSNSFGSIFSSSKAGAADKVDPDPFKIGTVGFPEDKIPSNPAKYLEEHDCDKEVAEWKTKSAEAANSSKVNPDTGMPEHVDYSPCLLIKLSIGASGGIYDKSLLDPEDVAAVDGGSGGDSGTTETSSVGDVSAADLAKPSDKVACAGGTKDVGVSTGYSGGNPIKIRLCAIPDLPSSSEESKKGTAYYVDGANGNALVNSRVSANFAALVKAAKKDSIKMSANSSYRTMKHQQALCNGNALCNIGTYTIVAKPGTSNHQLGAAIDFAMNDQSKYPLDSSACVDKGGRCSAPGDKVWEWLDKNASKYGIKPYKAEFWHWSATGN